MKRAPIPHKIFMEGEYDELHGKGAIGKEKQEQINAIYNNIVQYSGFKDNEIEISQKKILKIKVKPCSAKQPPRQGTMKNLLGDNKTQEQIEDDDSFANMSKLVIEKHTL